MAVLERLWLSDFRNYVELDWQPAPGRLVIGGRNGQGKSNLVEAIALVGSMTSFRGAPTDALVRAGAERAIVRAEVLVDDRRLLVEIELAQGRPNRVQVNKQRVQRRGDLVGLVPVTVFGPDDLELIKGGPGLRREYLDDLLVQLHPAHARTRAEVERVLKQRNALLRSAHGRMSPDIEATLAVWDAKFVDAGEAWADARADLVRRLAPRVGAAYDHLAGANHDVELTYAPTWRPTGLTAALAEVRHDEVRRGVTLVGPHRDELVVSLASLPARTQASQGEQRTLALALRIAGHHEVAAICGTSPLLVLDDVFSELDGGRVDALMSLLVADQTFVTTAASTAPVTADAGWWTVTSGTVRPGRPES